MTTREAILDSAEHVCRRRGFDAFSFADVSAAVGIRKASVHHYFPTKADLAVTLIERYAARILERLSAIEAKEVRAAGRLRAFIRLYRDALTGGDSLCLCVALAPSRESLPDRAIDRINAFSRDVAAFLTRVFELAARDGSIRNLSSARDEASAARALVEGAQLLARAGRRPVLFDNAMRSLLQRAI